MMNVKSVGFTVAPLDDWTFTSRFPAFQFWACSTVLGLFVFGFVPIPDTITYKTAARTTVIATIKMVPITGDTAFLFFVPNTVFIRFCPPIEVLRPHFARPVLPVFIRSPANLGASPGRKNGSQAWASSTGNGGRGGEREGLRGRVPRASGQGYLTRRGKGSRGTWSFAPPSAPAESTGAAKGAGRLSRAPAVRVVLGDSRRMEQLQDGAVALVVTSPPYPMIAMWDALFASQGARNYDEMHARLDEVWREVTRVLIPGGLACVVVGDALRKVDGRFRLFPNHARVMESFLALGLDALPYILWKKPTNKPNAFLGSGFLPPNAYVTLDCEFILIFRKGALRKSPRLDETRTRSVYTKAERDVWFSQVWEVKGAKQARGEGARRAAAFPPEVPRRLISIFSVEGDLVLDPFVGTGTTLA